MDQAEEVRLVFSRHLVQPLRIEAFARPGVGIHVDVAGVERGHVLEEMRTLAGIHPEVFQAALHDGPRLGDVAPLHRYAQRRDARAPATVAHEHIVATVGAHPVVELLEFRRHLARLHHVEGGFAQVHEVTHPGDPSRTDGAAGRYQGALRVDAAPVHLRTEAVGGDGPYLQDVEDGRRIRTGVQVGREFDLHPALDLLFHDVQQLVQDVRQREGVVFEDVRESHEFRALRGRRVHHAHILVVVGGNHFGESPEAFAFRGRDTVQVDRIVDGGLEFVRLQVECEHRLLRLAHHQLRRRGLQDVARVFRREAEHLVAVHDGLAEAESHFRDTVFRLLVADRVEIDRTGHAREGREEIALVLAAADLLQDDGHLLLGEHVGRGCDIASGRGEVHGGIDTLDRLGEQAELLVLVLRMRNHIGRIHTRKRLVVRIFQLGRRTHRERLAHVADEDTQRIRKLLRERRSHEFREDFGVREIGVDDIFQAVLPDERVEVFGGDDQRAGYQHAHVLPLVVQVVFLEYVVQKGEAARLAAQGALADAGEPDGVVVRSGIETCDYAEPLADAVVADHPEIHLTHVRHILVGMDADRAEKVPDGKNTAAIEPAGDVVLVGQLPQGAVGHPGDHLLELIEVAGTRGDTTGLGIGHDEIAETELPADVFRHLLREGLGALVYKAHPQLLGHRPHAFLRGLHQERHRRVLMPHQTAEVDAGVDLLLLGLVAAVDDETDVGDNADDVGLVFLVVVVGFVVAGRHQDFGAGALAEVLLFLVERVPHRLAVLLEHQLVQQRQIGRIVTHGILHQQDDAGPHLQAVVLGVEAVLQQLDDGNEHIGAVVPAEHVIDPGVVAFGDVAVDLPGERGEQDDRGVRRQLLGLQGEAEHIQLPDVVHRDDEIEVRVRAQNLQGVHRGLRTYDGRRVAQVELGIVLGDLRFDVSVLFEGETVIVVTNQEDSANPPGHQLGIIRVVAHTRFKPVPGPPSRWPP